MREIWFTVAELAQRWEVTPNTVEKLLRSKRLQGLKVGRFWRIHQKAIIAYEQKAIPENKREAAGFATVPHALGH